MSDFLQMAANQVFAFCVSRGWNSKAWGFWQNYREATARLRSGIVLGCADATDADERHVLSASTLEEFFQKQAWNQQQQAAFEQKLWRVYDYR